MLLATLVMVAAGGQNGGICSDHSDAAISVDCVVADMEVMVVLGSGAAEQCREPDASHVYVVVGSHNTITCSAEAIAWRQ